MSEINREKIDYMPAVNQTALKYITDFFSRNCFPHSWLIYGQPGTGRYDLALEVARCFGERFTGQSGKHEFFLVESEKDEKTGREKEISAEQIRRIQEQFSYLGKQGMGKVLLIRNGNRLNRFSANALLKTIEEPPPNSLVIVIADRPDQLIPTLRSRLAKVSSRSMTKEEAKEYLGKKFFQISEVSIDKAITLSNGRINEAKRLLGDEALLVETEKMLKNFRLALKGDLLLGMELADNWIQNRSSFENDFIRLVFYLRDVIIQSEKLNINLAARVVVIIRRLLETKKKIDCSAGSAKVVLENFFVQTV